MTARQNLHTKALGDQYCEARTASGYGRMASSRMHRFEGQGPSKSLFELITTGKLRFLITHKNWI